MGVKSESKSSQIYDHESEIVKLLLNFKPIIVFIPSYHCDGSKAISLKTG